MRLGFAELLWSSVLVAALCARALPTPCGSDAGGPMATLDAGGNPEALQSKRVTVPAKRSERSSHRRAEIKTRCRNAGIPDEDRLLHFEANLGQVAPAVKFLYQGKGFALFLGPAEAVLVLHGHGFTAATPGAFRKRVRTPQEGPVLRMKFAGGDPEARIVGLDEHAGKVNYIVGNDPRQWRTQIPTFGKVKYEGIYPGIDVVFYFSGRQLEYDFVVAPGASPSLIRLKFEGVSQMKLNDPGDLQLVVGGRDLRIREPVIFQEKNGVKHEIKGHYVVLGEREAGVQVAAYDTNAPLVIDPVLVYSTYLGGRSADGAAEIATDAAGATYVLGYTESVDFPTKGAYQPALRRLFITKLSPDGGQLVYSTYFGGTCLDMAGDIEVDTVGCAYVVGTTCSKDFPVVSPFQSSLPGQQSAYVSKLSADGSALVYSTYFGGSGNDYSKALALDAAGCVTIAGKTGSKDLPLENAIRQTHEGAGSYGEAFVTKLGPDGSSLVYSTYLGGESWDEAWDVAVDAAGNAYITGTTASLDFPMLNALQNYGGGSFDAFAVKLSWDGSELLYSTYLGGSERDWGRGIAVDQLGQAYVTGRTFSADFPGKRAFQPEYAGNSDAFLAKLCADGSRLGYGTYLGGGGEDAGLAVAVDSGGSAFVAGYTYSSDYPLKDPLQAVLGGFPTYYSDVLVSAIMPRGDALLFSTFLGGSEDDGTRAIALGAAGEAYVAGGTQSSDFPVANAYEPAYRGGYQDAFITKIRFENVQPGEPAAGCSEGDEDEDADEDADETWDQDEAFD